MSKKKILVVMGPLSEGGGVGGASPGLEEVENSCSEVCEQLGVALEFRKGATANELFSVVTKESGQFDGMIVSPGDIALSDSIKSGQLDEAKTALVEMNGPVVEVHAENLFLGGERAGSPLHIPGAELGFVSGFGLDSYRFAIKAIAKRLFT